MVSLLAGCVSCHRPGAGYSACGDCGLSYCAGCKNRLAGVCLNCGSTII